jgi:hypothetical protein
MAFIQLIEIVTTRPDEVEAWGSEWQTQTVGRGTTQRETVTWDQERPNTVRQLMEVSSYEDATANSGGPRYGILCRTSAAVVR